MAKKVKQSLKEQAVKAALSLAATKGWEAVTMADIARKCKVSEAALLKECEDKTALLAAYGRMIDDRLSGNQSSPDNPRDALFDILMDRFDILNEDREAVLSILESFTANPLQAVITLPHLARSMARMLEIAGVEAQGPCGALQTAGLTGVYLMTLRVWKDDESPDLAKTMAALDSNLGKAESLAGFMGLARPA